MNTEREAERSPFFVKQVVKIFQFKEIDPKHWKLYLNMKNLMEILDLDIKDKTDLIWNSIPVENISIPDSHEKFVIG